MNQTDERAMNRRITGNIIRGSIGNMMEWYDWFVYITLAIYFSAQFFPKGDPTSQLLNSAAVFAVGFLMRPLGSILMGRYADRHGRRAAITLSVTGMALGSLLIALTPGYSKIGVLAPTLLVIARLIQGLSVGGEYATTATYLSEMAKSGRRGFYSSFQYVTIVLGQVLGIAVLLILQYMFTKSQMTAWGWRIPFVIGAIGALSILWMQFSMDESEQFAKMGSETRAIAGTFRTLMKHKKASLIVVGLTLGGTISYYTFTTYALTFMVNTVKLDKITVSWINFFALLIFALIQPLGGMLSDRVGRRPLLLGFGILGTLLTAPIFLIMQNTKNPISAFLLMVLGLVIVSGYTSINAVVKAELFPVEIRALGVGLPYALTVAIFGGTVDYVALWLKHIGSEQLFFFYISACVFVSFITYWRMGESSKTSFIEAEAGVGNASSVRNNHKSSNTNM